MPKRAWSIHEWISRVLAGGALGCVVLLAIDLFVLIPFWELPLLKSDPRWETVFFVAKVGLPLAITLGAVAGLAWRRSRELQLSRGALVGCCLAVALISQWLRPMVARIHRGGIGPLYEVVPDTLAVVFCLLAVAVAVWYRGPGTSAPETPFGAVSDCATDSRSR
jgi:hypothetical protein